ncbi:hypothetical protein K2173_022279 [Erythroxylum novogranatense]|uniref:Uncharacterized protein n=1 Tax=Erythroxylum novogranatense TaxID=1862640 RepID=A0AAV8TIX6_9ROSI|nr:hypothetical protein K2173_022279 [Erythroxylum novogranatense]
MRQVNEAYLLKLAWKFLTNPDLLWVRLLKAKYGAGDSFLPKMVSSSRCSHVWQGICKAWPALQKGTSWLLGTGTNARFWTDNWLGGTGNLQSLALQNIPADHLHRDVASYVVTNGVWDMVSLRPFISSAILDILALSPTPNLGGDEDVVLWEHTSSGECTMKSAYQFIRNELEPVNHEPWKLLWRWRHNIMADHDAQDALGLQPFTPQGVLLFKRSDMEYLKATE